MQVLRPTFNLHRIHLPKLQYHKPFCFPFDYIVFGYPLCINRIPLVCSAAIFRSSVILYISIWVEQHRTDGKCFFSIILQNNGIILNASKSIIVIILPPCIVYNASLHLWVMQTKSTHRTEVSKKVNGMGLLQTRDLRWLHEVEKTRPSRMIPEYRRLFTHFENASLHRWAHDAMVHHQGGTQ